MTHAYSEAAVLARTRLETVGPRDLGGENISMRLAAPAGVRTEEVGNLSDQQIGQWPLVSIRSRISRKLLCGGGMRRGSIFEVASAVSGLGFTVAKVVHAARIVWAARPSSIWKTPAVSG